MAKKQQRPSETGKRYLASALALSANPHGVSSETKGGRSDVLIGRTRDAMSRCFPDLLFCPR
jgi:hypothetical protein